MIQGSEGHDMILGRTWSNNRVSVPTLRDTMGSNVRVLGVTLMGSICACKKDAPSNIIPNVTFNAALAGYVIVAIHDAGSSHTY